MRSKILVILLTAVILGTTVHAAPGSISSTELIEEAADWDGEEIVYEGEVIGEVLMRGQWAWINISDGQNTIGCYVSAAQTKQIRFCGQYGVKGDTVRVEGVFARACAEHGGDPDLHAQTLTVLQTGAKQNLPHSRGLTAAACVTSGIALCLLLLAILRHRCYNHR